MATVDSPFTTRISSPAPPRARRGPKAQSQGSSQKADRLCPEASSDLVDDHWLRREALKGPGFQGRVNMERSRLLSSLAQRGLCDHGPAAAQDIPKTLCMLSEFHTSDQRQPQATFVACCSKHGREAMAQTCAEQLSFEHFLGSGALESSFNGQLQSPFKVNSIFRSNRPMRASMQP